MVMSRVQATLHAGSPHRPRLALLASIVAVSSAASLAWLVVSPLVASAQVNTVQGSATGIQASGLVFVPPTPTVSLPSGGGGPFTASAPSASVPGIITVGALNVSTQGSNVPGANGTASSSSSVASVSLLVNALTADALTSSCTSNASGSVGGTTLANLKLGGTPVLLPTPIPPNFGLSVPGVASVVLNRQVASDAPGNTSLIVDAGYIQALGGLTTIKVGESSCSAIGPDVNAVPSVSGLTPNTGPTAGGTSVTITGTDFLGATGVHFGNLLATTVVVDSATQITATSPAHGAGPVDVTVTTGHGTSPTSPADQYTYTNTPVVTGINPTSGPAVGGTSVTISGSGFTGATAVNFGATPASSFSCGSDTSCTASSPAGIAGSTVDVTVVTPSGTSPTSGSDKFTYNGVNPPPVVDSVAPASGPTPGGTGVTITGANLSGATAINFGTNPATNINCSASSCTATSPAGSAGTVDVTVVTPNGTSATNPNDHFTYVNGPTVTGVNPSGGPTAGGTPVTITGTNLCNASAVDFGSTPVTTFTTNQACTEISTTSPPGTSGTVDVTVVTPGGSSPTNPSDHFTYAPVPTLSGINPNFGPEAGGTVVTLTGSGFTGTTAVNFGANTAPNFTCTSDTSCTATSPPGTGTVNVTVTTSGGTSPSGPGTTFTYIPADPYHPLTPYRIADTRPGSSEPYSGQTLGAGSNPETLDVQVTGTTGPSGQTVPANATDVVLNVTAVNASASGFFTVYPTGVNQPLASNLSFTPGQIVPNLVEVAVGAGGKDTVFNHTGSTDLVVDVEGYVGPGTGPSGQFNALSPSRVADTRPGSNEPYAGQTLGSGNNHDPNATLNVQVTGRGGVPASGVSAVVLNVTATNPNQSGFLTVYPQGAAFPLASNVNTVPGQTVPNRVVVPVGPTGQISIFNHAGNTDVVVDVNGWFTDSSSGGTGQLFSGFAPSRIADTRSNSNEPYAGQTLGSGMNGDPTSTLRMQVSGTGGVPAMSAPKPPTSVVLSVTVTDTTQPSFLTVFPGGSSLPLASDLNWTPGQTISNLVVVKLGPDGTVSFFNHSGSTDVVVDVVGFYS